MNIRSVFRLGLALAAGQFAVSDPLLAEVPPRLPVKEVSVFKDGHAFVVHEGRLPVDGQGRVTLDTLPTAVLGTFWAYAAAPKAARLRSVIAERREVPVERTALSLRELLEANIGAELLITETNQLAYPATVLGFPTRSSEELAEASAGAAIHHVPQPGSFVLLKTAEGTKAVAVDRIQDVTFKQPPRAKGTQTELRSFLTLNLEHTGNGSAPTAEVGLMYLQRGIRWIPSYRVDLDGQGQARIRLQATVLNELVDLDNVTLQLVIGVPSFAFKDSLDPTAMQESVAQLSAFFHGAAGARRREDALLSNFSNALMTQTVRMGEYGVLSEGPGRGDPELPEGTRNEDLFVFTVPEVTLRRGSRIVLPIAEVTVPYDDVFTLDLPFAPPPELARGLNSQQQAELARLLNAPKAMHKVRLRNSSGQPFTTAPALILRGGRVLAQGLMTYTASGASTDLALTTAVDVQIQKSDRETRRTPNAFQQAGHSYLRVDLQGAVRLINHRNQAITVEVTRHVLGKVNSADHDGQVTMSNVFESRDHLPIGEGEGSGWWRGGFNWPWWWHQVNGVGRITWNLELEPSQQLDLGYTWHYFWQ